MAGFFHTQKEVMLHEKSAPRLQFADEERGDPVLKKPIRRAQNTAASGSDAGKDIEKNRKSAIPAGGQSVQILPSGS